jgi:hypothetical protein
VLTAALVDQELHRHRPQSRTRPPPAHPQRSNCYKIMRLPSTHIRMASGGNTAVISSLTPMAVPLRVKGRSPARHPGPAQKPDPQPSRCHNAPVLTVSMPHCAGSRPAAVTGRPPHPGTPGDPGTQATAAAAGTGRTAAGPRGRQPGQHAARTHSMSRNDRNPECRNDRNLSPCRFP